MRCLNCGGHIEAYPVIVYARPLSFGVLHEEDRYRCSVCLTGWDVDPTPRPRVQGPFTVRP